MWQPHLICTSLKEVWRTIGIDTQNVLSDTLQSGFDLWKAGSAQLSFLELFTFLHLHFFSNLLVPLIAGSGRPRLSLISFWRYYMWSFPSLLFAPVSMQFIHVHTYMVFCRSTTLQWTDKLSNQNTGYIRQNAQYSWRVWLILIPKYWSKLI